MLLNVFVFQAGPILIFIYHSTHSFLYQRKFAITYLMIIKTTASDRVARANERFSSVVSQLIFIRSL